MLTSIILIFLALFQSLPSCVTATNGSCPHISSITNTNAILYVIPNSSPPAALSFSGMYAPRMNPSSVLLALIENMQPVCRHFTDPFPPSRVFYYGPVKVTLQNLYLSCGPLTYNDACTALRGLAEFMVLNNGFYRWTFQIWVYGYALGGGQIENIQQVLQATSVSGVATS